MSELDEDVFEVLEALGIEDARLSDARVIADTVREYVGALRGRKVSDLASNV